MYGLPNKEKQWKKMKRKLNCIVNLHKMTLSKDESQPVSSEQSKQRLK